MHQCTITFKNLPTVLGYASFSNSISIADWLITLTCTKGILGVTASHYLDFPERSVLQIE